MTIGLMAIGDIGPFAQRLAGRWLLVATMTLCVVAQGCSVTSSPAPVGTAVSMATATTVGLTAHPTAAPGAPPDAGTSPPPQEPAFPAVVGLTWLDGVPSDPAMRSAVGGFVRWQGPSTGEQAELSADGSYRWAGPDGSMVGCVAGASKGAGHLRCIGVDSEGNTAVTDYASGPRTVYGPGGELIGEFRSDGTRIAVVRPELTLDEAIADSGVDMAALVDFATGRESFAGGVTGDPHLITLGGPRISTQQSGDFQARTGDPARQLQIRVEPMPYQSDVSYVTASAVGVPGHRIELSLDGTLAIDGTPVEAGDRFSQTAVPGGTVVGWWPADSDGAVDVVVLWPDGSTVSMSADSSLGLTVIARLPGGAVGGLFAVAGSDAQVIDGWRVPAGESQFSKSAASAGQPTAAPVQVSAAATLGAEKSCAAGGFTRADDLAACVFDVARTGDDGYVVHHLELAAAATAPAVPASLARDWPGLVLGVATSPEALGLGGEIDDRVPAGGRRLYRLTLDGPAGLSLDAGECRDHSTGAEAARGEAALRLFDSSGRAVTDRRPDCGHGRTGVLPSGAYYLLLAGPRVGAAATFKVRIGGAG